MGIFQHREKQIHYELHAGIAPEDILFVHGNLASNRWWLPTLQALSGRYKAQHMTGAVGLAEWIGCGGSSAPKTEADLGFMSLAGDYVATAKALGLSDVCLVGHAAGGLIALCAMLLEPSLFRRAILLDPVASSGSKNGPELDEEFTKMSTDKSFCSTTIAKTIYQCNSSDPFVQQLFDDAYNVNKMIWHGVSNALKNVDIKSRLKEIKQPVLVLHGEHDLVVPINESRAIAVGLPHGQFVEIKGQGHCCHVENPGKFVELIAGFLGKEN